MKADSWFGGSAGVCDDPMELKKDVSMMCSASLGNGRSSATAFSSEREPWLAAK